MTREQVIDEIADDRVRFVPELGHHTANESVAAAVPFEIDRAMNIAGAMDFRPAVRAPRLFRPDFDEVKFLFQFRIAHDLTAQRSASGRDHLDHGLHQSLGSIARTFAILLTAREPRGWLLKELQFQFIRVNCA